MKAPERGNLRVPESVANVYRDMRDRQLLLVAGALLVAIIAVPFLLGGEDPSPPTPPPADAATAGAEEIDPVVLADVPGLRNFHERLDHLPSRNPFKQQFAGAADPTGGDGGGSGGGNLPTAESASSSTASSATTDSEDPSTSATSSLPSQGQPGEGSSDAPGNSGHGSEPQVRLITYRLDVRVGPVGKTKVVRGVKNLTLLPDRRRPIVQYVQSDSEGERASFIVSPEAKALKGDGRCAPSRSRCQYMLMKPGDDQYFRYEPEGRAYRLELLAIKRHAEPVKERPAEAGDGDGTFDAERWGFTATRSADRSG